MLYFQIKVAYFSIQTFFKKNIKYSLSLSKPHHLWKFQSNLPLRPGALYSTGNKVCELRPYSGFCWSALKNGIIFPLLVRHYVFSHYRNNGIVITPTGNLFSVWSLWQKLRLFSQDQVRLTLSLTLLLSALFRQTLTWTIFQVILRRVLKAFTFFSIV